MPKAGRVAFVTPTIARPFPAYLASMEAMLPALEQAGWEHGAGFKVGSPYIAHARAELLRQALDWKADVVVFLDHDMEWRPEDMLKLLAVDDDVVAGTYRYKKDDEEYMGVLSATADGRPIPREDGCILADRIPAGFLKITTACVDKFIRAYPELMFGPAYAPGIDLFNYGARNGILWGEDYSFSNRWRECGGRIWLIPDLNLTHHSADKAFPGNYHEYLLRQPGGSKADANAR